MQKGKLNYCLIGFYMLFASCSTFSDNHPEEKDLPEILRKGKLIVLTENTPYSYYEYRDEKSGFEFEILEAFSKSSNIELEYHIVENEVDRFQFLEESKGDIISANLPINLFHDKVCYSQSFQKSKVVLVRNKQKTEFNLDSLENKKIHVPKNSFYENFIIDFKKETGINFRIVSIDDIGKLQLIDKVESGEIDFTICHSNDLHLKDVDFENINYSFPLSFNQKIGFGFRKNSDQLKNKLDSFLIDFIVTDEFLKLKKKYFEIHFLSPPKKFKSSKESISPYDELFKRSVKGSGWDWKLIAAIAQKESNFNPMAIGNGGSFGVMQLMPFIGEKYGVTIESSVEDQIQIGVKILSGLYENWKKIPDMTQRSKFALASYNAGIGHIIDARNLAIELGYDPLKWDNNVELALVKLRDPKNSRKAIIKCGSYYGHAEYYVSRIFEIYTEYKEMNSVEK